MELIALKCPNCDALVHIEPGNKTCYCTHCGSQIYISDSNDKTITYIDAAKIKEAEVKERIRYKELDVQNKSRKSKRLSEFIKYFFIIFIIILLYNVFSNTDFIRGLLLSLIAAIPIAAILGIVFIFYLIITFPTSETI